MPWRQRCRIRRMSLYHRNEPRTRNFHAHDAAMLSQQLLHAASQKAPQRLGWPERQPALGQAMHPGVVLLLRSRVRVAAAYVAAEVAIKGRADMPQLVHDGDQLLGKIEVHEPR